MEYLEARRLTGPSLLFDVPAAILDVACSRDEAEALRPLWQASVRRMHAELGWASCEFAERHLAGGVSLAFTAPIDALYAASEINEWAWAASAASLRGGDAPDFGASAAAIRETYADEANRPLLALQAAAGERGVAFLWDDDEVSLGLGRGAKTWPTRELPAPDAVDWAARHRIPIGLVTGTNGKTTTARLAKQIMRAGDRNVGLSSTDWIAVNEEVLDRGDWSGPGGARAVLRHSDVDVAILETARGGLLRRGLGVERADAALITNVSEDHLGDFGSRSVDELLEIKWIVSRAVRATGRLVLNADDRRLVARAENYDGELAWFSLDERNPRIEAHAASGGLAFVCATGQLLKIERGAREPICSDHEIPISMNGAARHNVANALAAAALTWCMGASIADIRAGLRTMSQDDNPGRCNIYEVGGRKVLVDFAHNPQAMRALLDMAEAIPAARRVLCFGQAGDRPDELIRAMTRDAWDIGLDRVIVSELAKYHRGRQHGEVHAVIRDELLALGARADQIAHFEEESESLEAAFEWAAEGDLVIMLALGGAGPIRDQLRSLG